MRRSDTHTNVIGSVRRHAVKEAGNQPRQNECPAQTRRHAEHGELEAVAYDCA